MNPTELIRKKRNGDKFSREELEFLINGYLDGGVAEYQMAALLMAIYFKGMDSEETFILTEIMLHSGVVVDLSFISGIKVDKHSTGGVGDKVSLILAPMVAACGVPVPMISGRGLGHTGGTLDKLESIPGFRTDLALEEYRKIIHETGVVMMGQTQEIAPADKRLYALRDVTGTVESIPLICSSIMSKKLAEGIDALVLDIKTGRGAFMQERDGAILLAETLIGVGNKFGKRTVGLLTSMDQPLGYAVGNWLEVVECVECLKSQEMPDLMEVTYALGGVMLLLGEQVATIGEGIERCKEAISSGKGLKKFRELVARQGGDGTFVDQPEKYPKSAYRAEVKAPLAGYIDTIDALELGYTAIMLGAGRTKVGDVIDLKAGILLKKKIGDRVEAGDTLAYLFTDRANILEDAQRRLERGVGISAGPPVLKPLIQAMIDKDGVHPWNPG